MLPSTSSTVRLWISRTCETVSAAASTRSRIAASAPCGSTWTTTSIPGKASCRASSTRSAAAWPWPIAAPGATPMTTSAKCSPPARRSRSRRSSTGGSSVGDRPTRDPRLVLGRAVHEHVDVPAARAGPRRRRRAPRRRALRSSRPRGNAERRGDEAGEDGERPGEVAPEVERVRRAARRCGRAARRVARPSSARRRSRARARPPRTSTRSGRRRTRRRRPGGGSRRRRCTTLTSDEEAGLGERGEVLRLRVAVGVAAVGGAHGDGDGEEREQRRGEVRPRVRRLGEQARGSSSRGRRRA